MRSQRSTLWFIATTKQTYQAASFITLAIITIGNLFLFTMDGKSDEPILG